MKNFYAKSNFETIQEHTDKLLSNLQIIKKLYPDINVNWDLLEISCIYHDIGKINKKFQDKVTGIERHIDEVPHAFLSIALLNTKELKKFFTADEISALISAIAYHHERNFPDEELYNKEIENIKEAINEFSYEKIKFEINPKRPSAKYFMKCKPTSESSKEIFQNYLMVKGLLNRLDYAASAYEPVEIENDFLENHLEEMLEKLKEKKPRAKWNELQRYMIENRDSNLVVVAQTGMGKTEAGLLWIGNNKGFFTLPLKTAINAIFKRVSEGMGGNIDKKIGLLHSETYREYMEFNSDINNVLDIDSYYTKTKQLSMPLTICTLDQIFDFVYRYRGFELKPATLSYSKIIIDEIQMYTPNLLAYIVYGLEYITKLGGKFAIVTATMPPFFIDILRGRGIEFKHPKPFLNSRIRHSLNVIHEKINANFIKNQFNNNRVLVICNTIKEAQRIHTKLKELNLDSTLFHSSFIKKDRKVKENAILKIGESNEDSKEGKSGIWVCTQVVEASLDIDFDILITELSDLNSLFQRMGRCYRDRDFTQEGYNCFVFDGGDKRCSGVGAFIDGEIFKFSKEALKNDFQNGRIDEKQKIELIKKVYTTSKIKGTAYYSKIIESIQYLDGTYDYELSKQDVAVRFRDIKNFTIIPKIIFENKVNKEVIMNLIDILRTKQTRKMTEDEIKGLKRKKIKARNELLEFTMQAPIFMIKDYDVAKEVQEINSYELIYVVEIPYDSYMGLQTQGIKKLKEVKLDLGERMS